MRRETAENITVSCSACGASAVRGSAKYCLVCGKLLAESYQPLDTIRSSYGLQRTVLNTGSETVVTGDNLFEPANHNAASQFAWACFVYSLVPYLGIFFIPFTIAAAFAGLVASSRRPQIGGGSQAMSILGMSVLVLAFQLLLWWLLYIIPELGHSN